MNLPNLAAVVLAIVVLLLLATGLGTVAAAQVLAILSITFAVLGQAAPGLHRR